MIPISEFPRIMDADGEYRLSIPLFLLCFSLNITKYLDDVVFPIDS